MNKPSIALMWRGGCIIRSVFLKDITAAYRDNPDLENLLFNGFFNKAIHKAQPGWRDVISKCALLGIPTPAFGTALNWFDGYRTKTCQRTCSKLNAITLVLTPSKSSRSMPARNTLRARISMSTGRAVAEMFLPHHTLHKNFGCVIGAGSEPVFRIQITK